MVMDSRRMQRFDAYVTYTATRTVDGADERAAIGCLLRSGPERVKLSGFDTMIDWGSSHLTINGSPHNDTSKKR